MDLRVLRLNGICVAFLVNECHVHELICLNYHKIPSCSFGLENGMQESAKWLESYLLTGK